MKDIRAGLAFPVLDEQQVAELSEIGTLRSAADGLRPHIGAWRGPVALLKGGHQ